MQIKTFATQWSQDQDKRCPLLSKVELLHAADIFLWFHLSYTWRVASFGMTPTLQVPGERVHSLVQ